ncbi:hypothetical protein D3C80_1746130 [compost metagenome]
MHHAYHRPDAGTNQEPHLQTYDVYQPPADRLEQGIGQLEGGDHPRILLGGHVEAGFQFRCQNPQRVAGNVVNRDAQ